MNKEIKLYGEIGHGIQAFQFANQIAELEKQGCKHLTIHLHSQGGDVIAGNLIYNTMCQSSIYIKIVINGIAASMASIIILGANEVEICENAFIMIHRPKSGLHGNADDVKATAKVLNDIENNFIIQYSKKSKLSANEVKDKWLDGSDHWLNATEAVEYGFANRIVSSVAKDVKEVKISASMDVKAMYSKFVASLNINNKIDMKKELIKRFNLQDVTEDSSDEEVLQKLEELFNNLQTKVDENEDTNIEAVLNSALKENKISAMQKERYRLVGKTSGIATLTAILSDMRPHKTITSMLQEQDRTDTSKKAQSEWTLDDYRRHAPNELRNNPKLYAQLCKKEYGEQY